jgi:hypothetical protein
MTQREAQERARGDARARGQTVGVFSRAGIAVVLDDKGHVVGKFVLEKIPGFFQSYRCRYHSYEPNPN